MQVQVTEMTWYSAYQANRVFALWIVIGIGVGIQPLQVKDLLNQLKLSINKT